MGKVFTEKRKRELLVYVILWLVFAIVFVVPAAVAKVDSTTAGGKFEANDFLTCIIDYILTIETRVKAFQDAYIGTTGIIVRNYSLIYIIIVIILMLKAKDSTYHDIEHGSSDWSVGGEQYKVLSKNKGILLAEKNYLPTDKKGNVNVLIVGRIWCW